jgi:hypothetical protein
MRRRTFDALLATGGLIIAAVLVAAGGLLTWAHTFVADQVTTQLSAQQIYFPPKGEATANPEIGPYLNQYAGKQLTTGTQAKAYADHFIAVHIEEMTGGQTYAQLSAKAMANPDDQKTAGLVATVFKGETLRSMLLNAYGWWKVSQIAYIAALAAFGLGAVAAFGSAFLFLAGRKNAPMPPAGHETISPVTTA